MWDPEPHLPWLIKTTMVILTCGWVQGFPTHVCPHRVHVGPHTFRQDFHTCTHTHMCACQKYISWSVCALIWTFYHFPHFLRFQLSPNHVPRMEPVRALLESCVNGGGTTMWVQYRWYIVIVRCVPDMMVKIEGLDRLLPSIRRRVKHVIKGPFSMIFGTFVCEPYWLLSF